MKIAICEDERLWRTQLEDMVYRWAAQRKTELLLRSFPDSESFRFAWAEEKDWDVLFLDIEMGRENGMELAQRVRREDRETAIVFTTGYADYMAEGYDVGALQYLLKPVDEKRLFACLDRVEDRRRAEEKKLLFVTAQQVFVSLAPSKIWYGEAAGHGSILYTQEHSYELKMSFAALEELLRREESIVKCHRSYLVNLRYVKAVRRSGITLDDGRFLPVSRSAFPQVNVAFLRFYSRGQ